MNAFVMSLRRLYLKGSPVVTEEKLQDLKANDKINDKEYHYIKTGEM